MLQFHPQFRTPVIQLHLAAPKHFNFSLIRCSSLGTHPNPARDRVVNFGKHRGKMLGSLPSPYLQWISKNLRAGNTEHWARLADLVLEDPVYKDRIEWEFAEKLLNGDVLTTAPPPSSSSASSVDALLQISKRFGWDNEDKTGWSKVKFDLLGTSHGGRIPRVSDKASGGGGAPATSTVRRRSVREDGDREKRREERRVRRAKGSLGNEADSSGDSGGRTAADVHNRFPGRESLLRKAMLGSGREM